LGLIVAEELVKLRRAYFRLVDLKPPSSL